MEPLMFDVSKVVHTRHRWLTPGIAPHTLKLDPFEYRVKKIKDKTHRTN